HSVRIENSKPWGPEGMEPDGIVEVSNYAYGFEKPSAIQQRAVIPCIKAQSGTGKTTFAISILQQLDVEQKEAQALVPGPTRELAQTVILALGDYIRASCHMQKLQAEAYHIVVGTPGCVFDLLIRRFLCKYYLNKYYCFTFLRYKVQIPEAV
uniref:ATP-dependent RNA helicase n=1 Tax=Pygocentrus nattereri TaxID=42514 RepID=A0A3B4C781_PYGNA